MSNEYFQPGSTPAPNAPGSSAIIRGEFASIALGFDKLPVMAGHAGEIITVNGTGTGLVASGMIAGGFATLTGVKTLTNKTMDWAANTFVGFSQGLGIDLKAPINSPAFTGAPSAPTPPTGDASSRLATTFFVTNTISAIGAVTPGNNLPLMAGVATPGVDPALVSRQDHVHPSDTSRAPSSAATAIGTSFTPAGNIAATDVQLALQELDAEKAPLASPGFTGAPTAPTVADPSDTTTKIATTAWVQTRLTQIPVSVQLSNSTPVSLATTPIPGVGVEASRYDHVHALPSALQIPNTPAGTIAATNVQAALNELDGDIGLKQAAATAVTKDSQTGAAYIPAGTTAQRPGSPVVGYERFNSDTGKDETWNGSAWVSALYDSDTGTTANKVVKLNGSAQLPAIDGSLLTGVVPTIADNSITPAKLTQKLTLGTAQATTSGTLKDFTGIPSWAKRITVMLTGVSTNGTSVPQLRLGTGGVPQASGYEATAAIAGGSNQAGGASFSTGFGLINNHSASTALDISITLTLVNPATNKWLATINGCVGLSTFSITGGGYVSLSGALDIVRLTTINGTDSFDSGEWNYLVE